MKIDYFYENRKDIRKSVNQALGFALQKGRIKKNLIRKPKKFTQICLIDYILCIIVVFLIASFYNFSFDNIGTILFLFLLGIFFLNTLFLFYFLFALWGKKDTEGEIRFSKEGVTETTKSGKVVFKPWKKIKWVYMGEDIIYVFAKFTLYFFPYSDSNKEILMTALQTYKPDISIIIEENREENKFKKFFWNVGIYILLFIVSFSFSIGFDIYNETILNKEAEKMMLSHEVDFQIYSHQKYGIVEKYMKEYYAKYYELEEEYLKYNASGTLQRLTLDMFRENRNNLDDFIKDLTIYEQKAKCILDEMIAMYNHESALKLIQKENLEEYYESLYLNFLFTDDDSLFIQDLEEEKEINAEKMKYVEELINFLLKHLDDWIIEENRLYFYHTENAEIYNELYDFIMDEKEINNGIFI